MSKGVYLNATQLQEQEIRRLKKELQDTNDLLFECVQYRHAVENSCYFAAQALFSTLSDEERDAVTENVEESVIGVLNTRLTEVLTCQDTEWVARIVAGIVAELYPVSAELTEEERQQHPAILTQVRFLQSVYAAAEEEGIQALDKVEQMVASLDEDDDLPELSEEEELEASNAVGNLIAASREPSPAPAEDEQEIDVDAVELPDDVEEQLTRFHLLADDDEEDEVDE